MRLRMRPSYIEYDLSDSSSLTVIFAESAVQKLHDGVRYEIILNPRLAHDLICELTKFCANAGHPRHQGQAESEDGRGK